MPITPVFAFQKRKSSAAEVTGATSKKKKKKRRKCTGGEEDEVEAGLRIDSSADSEEHNDGDGRDDGGSDCDVDVGMCSVHV